MNSHHVDITINKRKRNNDIILQDLTPGQLLQGVVRLQVPRGFKNLDDRYEGIVLTLTGREVWMVDGRPLRLRANSRQAALFQEQDPNDLRHGVKMEKMITDFEFTQVGDGIDFRFPYAMRIPPLPTSQEDGDDEEEEAGLMLSMRSISSLLSSGDNNNNNRAASRPVKTIVYQLTASLKPKPTTCFSSPSEPSRIYNAEQASSPPQAVASY